MAAGFWPVAVVPVGWVASATTLWRAKGRLHVTCVVKARFEMVNGGFMKPILPEPVRPHLGELAPYLGQADVLITGGYAHCVPPRRVTALAVRLALFREWAVIDKSLLVYPRDADGARTAAVVTKLSLGEPDADGPAGIIVNPADPTQRGTLGPLGEDSVERVKALGGASVPQTRDGIVEIPDMFPWGYYQVAPPDQRASFLRGDEWIALDGVHPELARVQSRLPGAVAEVRVYPPGLVMGPCYPVAMQADQLNIDAERGHCSVLWRGSFAVAGEAAARSLTLVAGVALPGQPIAWPDVHQLMRNPILQAHGLASLPNPEAVEDDASMAPTRQVSQADVLAAAVALAQAGTKGRALPPRKAQGGRQGAVADEEPISLRAAELQVGEDGVLWLDAVDESVLLDLTPDPSLEEPVNQTVRMSAEELLGQARKAGGRTALGLPIPDGRRLLRPYAQVVTSAPEDPTAMVAPASSGAPNLDERSVDQLELTLSEVLADHGYDNIDDLADLSWRLPEKE